MRHFNPKAPSRFLRVRALSDLLILGAYVQILLVAMGIGLMIYFRLSGLIPSVSIFFVLIIGWLVAGIALFLFFKCLGELAFLLADGVHVAGGAGDAGDAPVGVAGDRAATRTYPGPLPVVAADAEFDRGAPRREVDRIADQVRQGLAQQERIPAHRRQARRAEPGR